MISAIYGYIGSGKTYHAVSEYILPMLKLGHTVVTNISGLDKRIIQDVHGIDTTKLILIKDSEVRGFWLPYRCEENPAGESKVVYVIDEIQNFYGASQWKENKDSRESLKVFLTKNRHYGHTVIWITQTPAMVHPDIVQLTETFIQCTKIGFIKFVAGNKYSYVIRSGYKNKNSQVLKQGFRKYDAKVFVCYQSFDPDVTETTTASDKPGWLPWKQIILISVFILFVITAKIAFWYFVGRKKSDVHPTSPITTSSIVQSPASTINKDMAVSVDGYFMVDGKVSWLQGTSVVAVSDDVGNRSGYIQTNIGTVHIVPRDLPIQTVSEPAEDMGRTPSRHEVGGAKDD